MRKLLVLWLLLAAHVWSQQTGQFYFCDSVDDNWDPVTPTTSVKAGASLCFLGKLKEKVNPGFVGWIIHRVGEDGKDDSFVEELQMGVEPDSRLFCTSEGFAFAKPGKYRVYLVDWKERKAAHAGNCKKYFAKGELTVTP